MEKVMTAKIWILAFSSAALAQQPVQPPSEAEARMLWDENFLRKRPPAKKTSRPAAQAISKAPVTTPEQVVSDPAEDAFLGITVWRLRPSRTADEPGVRILVQKEGDDQEWTPERIEADHPLVEGQRVRMSIETARAGYLYVVDREQYADGTFSDPFLIFPTLKTRGGINQVRAGALVEIPAWDDDPPYFRLRRRRADQVAETLMILVTPQPLSVPSLTHEALKLSTEQVAGWERRWSAAVKRLEARDKLGKPYTKAEKEAANNSKLLLTQDDPTPQTLYRVEAKAGDPLLVTVPLRIRK